MVLTAWLVLTVLAIVFLLMHTVVRPKRWPLWPSVLCLILLHLIGR